MDQWTAIGLCIAVAAFLGGAIFLRHKWRIELKATEVAAAGVVFAIGLVVTDQIAEFKYGDTSLRLKQELIQRIAVPETTIFEPEDEKRPNSGKSGGVSFYLFDVGCNQDFLSEENENNNTPSATDNRIIEGILEKFAFLPSPDYIVFTISDDCGTWKLALSSGQFYGFARRQEYADLSRLVREKQSLGKTAADGFLSGPEFKALVESDPSLIAFSLPSFVSRSDALETNSRKIDALNRMIDLDVLALPVIDEKGSFVHIIERDWLVASLLADFGKATVDE